MNRRDSEVDHDLDARMVEDGGHISPGWNVIFGGLLTSGPGDDIADRKHVGVGKTGEVLQIGVADSASADHTNAYRASHDQARSASRNSRLARTASSRSVSESSNSTTRSASGAAEMMSHTGTTPDPTGTCLLVSRVPSPSLMCRATTRSPRRASRAGTSAPPAYAQ